MKQKTAKDYHELGQKRGIIWLGTEVESSLVKTSWQCPNGHTWRTAYRTIRQGSGCPKCSYRRKPRKTAQDYHALAEKRGFTWLGTEVNTVDTKTHWQCTKGHRWLARYNLIKSGNNCPKCSIEQRRKTAEDYHELAQKRGFTWLETERKSIFTKTSWQCPFGHTWKTTYNCIRQGTGCPTCYKDKEK